MLNSIEKDVIFSFELPGGEFEGAEVFSLKNPCFDLRFVGSRAREILWQTSVLPPQFLLVHKYRVTHTEPLEAWLDFFAFQGEDVAFHPAVISGLLCEQPCSVAGNLCHTGMWNIIPVRGDAEQQRLIGVRWDTVGWTLSERLRGEEKTDFQEVLKRGDYIFSPIDLALKLNHK